jgi:NAD-dependent histone deacetylase SIR2
MQLVLNATGRIFAGTVPLCTMCTQSDAYIQQKAKRKQIDARNAKRRKFSSEWDGDDDGEEDDERNEWEGQPIMKPTITFFGPFFAKRRESGLLPWTGEKLADDFDERLMEDRDQVDLLIVMGTSLKVSCGWLLHQLL